MRVVVLTLIAPMACSTPRPSFDGVFVGDRAYLDPPAKPNAVSVSDWPRKPAPHGPDVGAIPAGHGWWCTRLPGVPGGPVLSRCERARSECETWRKLLIYLTGPCVAVPIAGCFTYAFQDGPTEASCYESPYACEWNAMSLTKSSAVYRDVSVCAEFD